MEYSKRLVPAPVLEAIPKFAASHVEGYLEMVHET